MVTGYHLLPPDPTPFIKCAAETYRDHVIRAATHYRLLNSPDHQFSLDVSNDALALFVRYAEWIERLTPSTLIDIARVRLEYPEDWRSLVQAKHFLSVARAMRPTYLPTVIQPARRMLPIWINQIILGNFLERVGILPDHSIDLVVTSPPYPERRVSEYDSVPEWRYPKWTVEWMRHIKRVLKPTGSVVVVLSPGVMKGTERLYVLRTCLQLAEDGWNKPSTFAWVKPDAPALGRADWPRTAWEPAHWFTLSANPWCNPKALGHYSKRLGLATRKGSSRHIHHRDAGQIKSGITRATNVITVPLSLNDRSPHNVHPAQYPVFLAESLIRILCPPGGIVLDPFAGSGSTVVAALRAGRYSVGFEKEARYHSYAVGRIRRFHLPNSNNPDRRPFRAFNAGY